MSPSSLPHGMPPGAAGMPGSGMINPYGPSGPPPTGISSQLSQRGVPPRMFSSSPVPSVPKISANPMNTFQLQQLSAQIKSYRLLSRNVAPPDALFTISQGRRPTPAMLAELGSRINPSTGTPGLPQSTSRSSTPVTSSSQPGGSDSQSNISLYPPSPNAGSQGSSSPGPQRTQNAPPSSSAAPNVTISASGELPLPVRQAMASAQAGSASPTPPSMTSTQAQMQQQQSTVTPPTGTSQSTAAAAGGATQAPPPQKIPTQIKQVKIAPPGKPQGLDPLIIIQEREVRITSRISHRIQELQDIPSNLLNDELRRKAMIELRALRLLEFQKQLRAEVLMCSRRSTTLETALNLRAYKRPKRQSVREARITEKLEKQQKLEQERRKRQKHQVCSQLLQYNSGYF